MTDSSSNGSSPIKPTKEPCTLHNIVKGVCILDNDGNRILAKYYDENVLPTEKEQKAFEKNLFNKTHRAYAKVITLDGLTCVYKSKVDLFCYVIASENKCMLRLVLDVLYKFVCPLLKELTGPDLLLGVDTMVWGLDLEIHGDGAALHTKDVPLGEQNVVQCITSQYLRGSNGIIGEGLAGQFAAPRSVPYIAEAAPWAALPCGAPLAPEFTAFQPSTGRSFPVTSVSPMGITGITMKSENTYEGPLSVTGAVPFLGGVALEGALPTSGAGAVSYGCGNGNFAMVSEDIAAYPGYNAGIAGELGYGYSPLALEAGIARPGYGYGYNRGCGGALF